MSAPVITESISRGLRADVEYFLYDEADLMDRWQLDKWLALFTPDCRYEVVTPGLPDPDNISADTNLFPIADDHARLEERVTRLKKTSTHVEFSRSVTSHLLGNIRVLAADGDEVRVRTRFVTWRTKSDETVCFLGHQLYRLIVSGDSFAIADKRTVLDIGSLSAQGKLSILL